MTDPGIDKMKPMPGNALERPAVVGVWADDEDVHEAERTRGKQLLAVE